ncbi:RNA polymerase II-binding domain-containing protein [Zopfochytrium polystomum]|nr:RNA polymerase II-binding domain-containing protein [Zopfochytrium polystomum]
MSVYSEVQLIAKLKTLVDTQESINLVSHWMTYHRKHAKTSVEVWAAEVLKANTARKLTFLHLCNDVLQTSRKRGGDFIREYAHVLPSTIPHIYSHVGKEVRSKVLRILAIWEERNVYPSGFIRGLKESLGAESGQPSASSQDPPRKSSVSGTSNERPEAVRALITRLDALRSAKTRRIDFEANAKQLPNDITQLPVDDVPRSISILSQYQTALNAEVEERKKLIRDLRALYDAEEKHQFVISGMLADTNSKLDTLNKIVSFADSSKRSPVPAAASVHPVAVPEVAHNAHQLQRQVHPQRLSNMALALGGLGGMSGSVDADSRDASDSQNGSDGRSSSSPVLKDFDGHGGASPQAGYGIELPGQILGAAAGRNGA